MTLHELNGRLASANAASAELMAELVAIIELRDEQIQTMNESLATANARSADLIGEREIQMEELKSLNGRLGTEIEQRGHAQDRMLEETAKLSAMISGMDEGVVFTDSRDRIVEANEYFLRLTEQGRSDLVGKSLWDLQGPPAELLRPCIEGFRNDPLSRPEVTEGTWGDLQVLLRLQPVYRDTRYRGFIFNVIDVTELVAAREEALNASKAKSRFLANMSHELRTPLNAILGFSQLMARSQTMPPDHQQDLQIIMRSGEHLLALINQVLDQSKIESGRISLNEQAFDLHQLLDELEDMFRLKADTKGLGLVFARAEDVPWSVRADEVKLRQVLINLLNNALRFTHTGGVTLRIADCGPRAAHPASGARTLCFQIEDTGPGIAPDEMAELFEAFVQTRAGQQEGEGTGLGLPISRRFVELMGGNVTVSSEVGRGSVFSFDVPVRVIEESQVEGREAARRVIALEPGQPRYRILIVDDGEDNRRLLVRLLAPLGFELREAADGQEAIEIWDEWDPHLIWMDMRMPVMDGYEATRRIRSNAKGQATAIIALTASSLEKDRAAVLSVGCDDFLHKPFPQADLFRMMNEQVGVRYVYDEPAGRPVISQPSGDLGAALSPTALAALPQELLTDLQQATIRINLAAMSTAVDEIRTRDAPLADALATRVDDFAYADILALVQEAEEQRW